jgi:hypothetical protein
VNGDLGGRVSPSGCGTKLNSSLLYSKIHNDNAAFDLFFLLYRMILLFLRAFQRNFEHRPLIPSLALFASANLFDDPGIEHWLLLPSNIY